MEPIALHGDASEIMHRAWSSDRIVIVAILAEGPDVGGEVLCITPRKNLNDTIKRAEREKSLRDKDFINSVRSALVTQIRCGTRALSAENDSNFMDDLATMMALKYAAKNDALLEGSGLFSLHIAVNPDDKAPWTARGLLRARDVSMPMAVAT